MGDLEARVAKALAFLVPLIDRDSEYFIEETVRIVSEDMPDGDKERTLKRIFAREMPRYGLSDDNADIAIDHIMNEFPDGFEMFTQGSTHSRRPRSAQDNVGDPTNDLADEIDDVLDEVFGRPHIQVHPRDIERKIDDEFNEKFESERIRRGIPEGGQEEYDFENAYRRELELKYQNGEYALTDEMIAERDRLREIDEGIEYENQTLHQFLDENAVWARYHYVPNVRDRILPSRIYELHEARVYNYLKHLAKTTPTYAREQLYNAIYEEALRIAEKYTWGGIERTSLLRDVALAGILLGQKVNGRQLYRDFHTVIDSFGIWTIDIGIKEDGSLGATKLA